MCSFFSSFIHRTNLDRWLTVCQALCQARDTTVSIVIVFLCCKKKYIQFSSLAPDPELPEPLEFCDRFSVFHHEPLSITPEFVLLRGLRMGALNSLWMGLVTRKAQ